MVGGVTHEEQGTAARVYGVLATSLNDAIEDSRQALSGHTELVRPGLLTDFDTLLAEFDRRRVRIAIYGEVKAGKSTLLNAIAGAPLSPAAFDPLTSIPVRVTYGGQTRWRAGDRVFDSITELAQMMRAGTNGVHEVVVETNLDLLQLGGQVDLLDTPGVGSEDRFDSISSAAVRHLDAVVLVVRYPALFTQFTRRLMGELESDIGKLFVVWNLDADCAELSAEERAQHAGTLRSRVAGAHELFLVDARAALQAVQANDGAARAASGIEALTTGLARFAGSEKREVVALREVAKRMHTWLDEAQRVLTAEHAALDNVLRGARSRIEAAHRTASGKADAARQQRDDLRATLARISEERAQTAGGLAAAFKKRLRAARRRWIANGQLDTLAATVADAGRAYADAVAAGDQRAFASVKTLTKTFGSLLDAVPRARTEPTVTPLAPAERIERAASGRWRLVRRAVWRRWYVPGVNQLEGEAIDADVSAQAAWFDGVAGAAVAATQATLDGRLAAIAAAEEAEIDGIKRETSFDAAEAKFAAVSRDLPVVNEQLRSVAQINVEARGLLG